ncbi:DUF4394 domain-containing protein [Microlunatus antarcticus]|uniref:DUF4394 domain-containing protein n=1 Tax=Microlunatus antarcticus TaxID=53388 RepID=A0A7W5P5Y5_9ACTN|nr:DUF4394 domain-containing protein [Microlunatus antarcticus]MBB3325807.1 hypothetical protein [Microlunatus antarcticus]
MKLRRVTIAIAAVAVAGLAVPATAMAASAEDATGLAGDRLVRFDTDKPTKAKRTKAITGLTGDASLVGIDRRVQNGKLYGVGNAGGLYTLSTSSAKATKVGQLSVALDGTSFGVDFNPAANALRVVSDTGQNLRQPFGEGDGPTVPTVTDGALTYVLPTGNVPGTGVAGAAYTNNDLAAATGTTLFVLDTNLDQIAVQSPANAGSLAATGKLGVDAGAGVGFDIFSDIKSGRTNSVEGYATVTVKGKSSFYTVDLLTGDIDKVGSLPYAVTDLAVDLD